MIERRFRDHPHCGWAGQVQDTLQAALALRDRRNAGALSDHGLATARGRLLAQISRLIAAGGALFNSWQIAGLAGRVDAMESTMQTGLDPAGRPHFGNPTQAIVVLNRRVAIARLNCRRALDYTSAALNHRKPIRQGDGSRNAAVAPGRPDPATSTTTHCRPSCR